MKDPISAYVNEAASSIREIEEIAARNRELLTRKAVENIRNFLRGQTEILISNLERLAIETPVPGLGAFSIDTPVEAPRAASGKPHKASRVPPAVQEPDDEETLPEVSCETLGRLRRATEADMKNDHQKPATETIDKVGFLTEE